MKSKAVKQVELEALQEEFKTADHLFVVQFEGLKVVAADELRSKVRASNAGYRVVKNTLARKACEGTDVAGLAECFTGPTAVVTVEEDPTQVAKTLSEFAKTNPQVTVKGGMVDGATLSAADCKALADIPSREELQARIAGVLMAPMQRLATVVSAPLRNVAVTLKQVAEKKESE